MLTQAQIAQKKKIQEALDELSKIAQIDSTAVKASILSNANRIDNAPVVVYEALKAQRARLGLTMPNLITWMKLGKEVKAGNRK